MLFSLKYGILIFVASFCSYFSSGYVISKYNVFIIPDGHTNVTISKVNIVSGVYDGVTISLDNGRDCASKSSSNCLVKGEELVKWYKERRSVAVVYYSDPKNHSVPYYFGNNTIKLPNGEFCIYSEKKCFNETHKFTWKPNCNNILNKKSRLEIVEHSSSANIVKLVVKEKGKNSTLVDLMLTEEIILMCNKFLWKTNKNTYYAMEDKVVAKLWKTEEKYVMYFKDNSFNIDDLLVYSAVVFIGFIILLWKISTNCYVLKSTNLSAAEIAVRSLSQNLTYQAVLLNNSSTKNDNLPPKTVENTYDYILYNRSIY